MYDYNEKDPEVFAEEYFVNNFFNHMLDGKDVYSLALESEQQGFLRGMRLEFELEG